MTAPALKIDNLTKTYENGHEALKGISFTVEAGDFFALLGPNGAGKSTTIGILCSLVKKSSGHVSVFGRDLDKNPNAVKELIGVVPQEFNFSIFETPMNIILNQAGYYGIPRSVAKKRADYYLKLLELWDKRNQVARNLSGGMKRRLMIARALVHEPKLLILDEPTAGVDIEIRRSMWTFLQKLNASGTTIILTTHYLEEAETLCKNIGIINKGELIKNTTMSNILNQLCTETFVVDSKLPIPTDFSLPDFKYKKMDDFHMEITVHKNQTLNTLFSALTQANVEISSLRNKSNRLEEQFLQLTSNESAS